MSTPTDMAAAAQALAAALLAATTDPADALRVLASLADFTPDPVTSTSAVGAAMAEMQGATGDLFRRAAVVALARASASYQPTSYEDAAAVRILVCGMLDAEITIAADQGEDATYTALRTLRAAVAQDLTARGASLAHVTTVTTAQPLPALVLANRLYGDAGRADELTAQADPVHPAFLPVRFKALAE